MYCWLTSSLPQGQAVSVLGRPSKDRQLYLSSDRSTPFPVDNLEIMLTSNVTILLAVGRMIVDYSFVMARLSTRTCPQHDKLSTPEKFTKPEIPLYCPRVGSSFFDAYSLFCSSSIVSSTMKMFRFFFHSHSHRMCAYLSSLLPWRDITQHYHHRHPPPADYQSGGG
jgi:hypothetical protein